MKMSYTPVELSVISAIEDGKMWTPAYFKQWAQTALTDPKTDPDLRVRIQYYLEENQDAAADDGIKLEISASAIVNWVSRTDKEYREEVDDRPAWVTPKGIRIEGARITGKGEECLDLDSVQFEYPIEIQNSDFEDGVILNDARLHRLSFRSSTLQFIESKNAKIFGDLDVSNSEISEQCMIERCSIEGDISFSAARVNHQNNSSKSIALNAQGIRVTGNVKLDDGFESQGHVWFYSCRIKGDFVCDGAKIQSENYALSAQGSFIDGVVSLDDSFEATGEVSFSGSVLNLFICGRCRIDGNRRSALTLYATRISSEARFVNLDRIKGNVSLLDAYIRVFYIDESSWHRGNGFRFLVDGLTYEKLDGETFIRWQSCLKWLRRHTPGNIFYPEMFTVQPWRQMTHVLTNMGRQKDARIIAAKRELRTSRLRIVRGVLIVPTVLGFLGGVILQLLLAAALNLFPRSSAQDELENRNGGSKKQQTTVSRIVLSTQSALSKQQQQASRTLADSLYVLRSYFADLISIPYTFTRHILFGWLTGFGYHPVRSLGVAILIVVFGTLIFKEARGLDRMRPGETYIIAGGDYQETGDVPGDYRCLQPLVYSIDLFIPLVNLSQDIYWVPRDTLQAKASEHRQECDQIVPVELAAIPKTLAVALQKVARSQPVHVLRAQTQNLLLAPRPWLTAFVQSTWLNWWYWFHISSGWVLSALIVAGFSRLLKSND